MNNENNVQVTAPKTKSNKGLMIILILMVVALAGYIAYDKFFSKKMATTATESTTSESTSKSESTSTSESTQNTSGLQYNRKLSDKKGVQALYEGNVEVLSDSTGDVYLAIPGTLDYETNATYKANLQKIQSQFKTYSPKNYMYMNGSTEISAYKLNVSGVLDMYYVTNGNGSDSFFVFLKENGTLSYLNYYNLLMTAQLDVKDISGMSNVVSVVQNSYTFAPYAVNLDGTITSLGEYLK